jgi:hypothetical protein
VDAQHEVLLAEEHFCVNDREPWQMAGFQDVVVDCDFVDLVFRAYHTSGITGRRELKM